MQRFILIVLALVTLLVTAACNLSNQAATPTAEATEILTDEAVPPPAASVTALPGVAATLDATRTPFNNNVAPTTQSQATALPNTFPTPASGERADITFPTSGGTVYAPTVYVSGVAHNLLQDQFTLQIFDSSGQPLTNGQTIPLSNPNKVADVPWSASVMVRSYTGAAQIRILAQISDGTEAVVGSVNVTIAAGTPSSAVQPSGETYVASITSPTDGSSVSGDPINVTGTAGGIAENQFTLLLLDGSGTVINSQVITLSGAEQNSVPWSAAMGTSGHHGSAEIRAVVVNNGQQITMTSVKINLQ
ncbi:MAG: hypothetical protein GC204_01040 [Chloroflexi bacterium]|nr:hypothetical protein [Chloroflexota bacterium]